MPAYVKAHFSQGQFIISSEMVLPSLRIQGINSDTYFSDEGAHTYTISDTQVTSFLHSENIVTARLIYGSDAEPQTIDFQVDNFFVPENKLTANVGHDRLYLFMDEQEQLAFSMNILPSGQALFENATLIAFEQNQNNIKLTLDVYAKSVAPSAVQILIGHEEKQQIMKIASATTSTFDMGQGTFKSRVLVEFSPTDIAREFDEIPSVQKNGAKTENTFWIEIDQDHQDIAPVVQPLTIEKATALTDAYTNYDQQLCMLIQPTLLATQQLAYVASFVPQELQIQLQAYQAKHPNSDHPRTGKRPVILITERVTEAHDNGSVMFNYLNKYHAKDFDTYYVITSESAERENLDHYEDHIITFQTPRHLELFLMADLFLFTHDVENLLPFDSNYLNQKISQTPKINLQHGIAGLKAQAVREKPAINEQIVVSSDREVEFVETEFGYKHNQILLTGLPRFDELLRNRMWSTFKARRHVLIMPTRRRKLMDVTEDEFKTSLFYTTYMQLINNPELKALAAEKRLQISFILHPDMREYRHLFHSDFVKILENKRRKDVSDLLRDNQIMITDYASVSFDFALQNRPVIYYQFDELVENRHFDIDPHDIVGPVVDNEDDLLFSLKNAVKQERLTNAQRSQVPENIYKQMDTKARKRVTQAIKKILK